MDQFSTPEELEKRFVHDAYKEIAPGFRNARYKAWPCVVEFLKSQPSGSIIADIGCGTGKYLSVTSNSFITGSDTCRRFVEIARERHHEVALCDTLRLPYRDGCFDAVISVGVIHHLASTRRRLNAIQELARILRPGGQLMVCVWAMEQSNRKFDGQDVLVPYRPHKGRARRRAQVELRKQSPKQTSKLVHDQCSIRRSKSCSTLDDEHLSQQREPKDTKGKETACDDASLNFITELGVLRDMLATLKHRKAQFITSLNAQVAKLHSEKNTGRMNLLLSKLFGRLFDGQNGTEDSKRKQKESLGQEGRIPNLPNIPNLVSDLVKRLFREKHQQRTQSESDSPRDWSGMCEGIARDPDAGSNRCLSRDGSFDSDCSEPDNTDYLEQWQKHNLPRPQIRDQPDNASRRTCYQDGPSNKITLHFLARLMESISSSSDTDSDGSISPDLFNSDSGISDSEQLGGTAHPSPRHNRNPYTTCTSMSCNEAPQTGDQSRVDTSACGDNKAPKNRELQRFYHVFREGELTELITRSVPTVEVIKECYHHGNWTVIVEKL